MRACNRARCVRCSPSLPVCRFALLAWSAGAALRRLRLALPAVVTLSRATDSLQRIHQIRQLHTASTTTQPVGWISGAPLRRTCSLCPAAEMYGNRYPGSGDRLGGHPGWDMRPAKNDPYAQLSAFIGERAGRLKRKALLLLSLLCRCWC